MSSSESGKITDRDLGTGGVNSLPYMSDPVVAAYIRQNKENQGESRTSCQSQLNQNGVSDGMNSKKCKNGGANSNTNGTSSGMCNHNKTLQRENHELGIPHKLGISGNGLCSTSAKEHSGPRGTSELQNSDIRHGRTQHNGIIANGEINGGFSATSTDLTIEASHSNNNSDRKGAPLIKGKIAHPRRNHHETNYADLIKIQHMQNRARTKSLLSPGMLLNRDPPYKRKLDYFGVMMSYMLGVGNVVRFSQLCHKHGGVAFFIPYILMLMLEGTPLLCLEMAVGQRFGKKSLVQAWGDLKPNLSGLGLAAIIENTIVLFYYNVLVTWCLYYFVQSLRGTLIWEPCGITSSVQGNQTSQIVETECAKAGAEKYFWYRKSLNISDDINSSSGVNMFMYLFVFMAWTSAWLLSMRGIRRSSKLMWLILVLIVVEFVIFFFFAVDLKGWTYGLSLLFSFDRLDTLKSIDVWLDAAGQIFYSMGIGYGSNILFSSGNNHDNNLFSDAIVCSLANSGTSIWASIIMFSFFGYRAHYKMSTCNEALTSNSTREIASFMFASNIQGNSTVQALAEGTQNCSREYFLGQLPEGMSLVFVGMSQAFAEMIDSTVVWAALFFLLIFLLGTSSVPGMVHVLVDAVMEFHLVPKRLSRPAVCGIVCIVFCMANILFVQSMGIYLLEIIDSASGFPLLVIGFCECIGLCYVYGLDKFSKDIELLTGSAPGWKWKLCWKFISPIIILGVIVGGMIDMIQHERTYKAWDKDKGQTTSKPYPDWASVLYCFVTILPIMCLFFPVFKKGFYKCFNKRTLRSIASECGLCKAVYERYRKYSNSHRRAGSYNVTSALKKSDYINDYAVENDGVELEESNRQQTTAKSNR